MNHSRTVLDFWFGREPMTPARFAARQPEWFGGRDAEARAARDRVIGEQFGALTARAAAGELDAWADSPRQRLALILLLISLFGRAVVDRLNWLSDPHGTFRKVVGALFLVVGFGVIFGLDRDLQAWILENGWYDPVQDVEGSLN